MQSLEPCMEACTNATVAIAVLAACTSRGPKPPVSQMLTQAYRSTCSSGACIYLHAHAPCTCMMRMSRNARFRLAQLQTPDDIISHDHHSLRQALPEASHFACLLPPHAADKRVMLQICG